MDVANLVQLIALYAIPAIFAITLHEAAHGYAARYFGDPTAYEKGRISLNPIRHIDPIGTLLIPAVVLFASGGKFAFGWAKPVPVNFGMLRNPKRDMLWVAAAGPGANLFMAVLWALLFKFIAVMPVNYFSEPALRMAEGGIIINLVLMVLNLFPMPPLDGGRIAVSLLPHRLAYQFARVEPYGMIILMVLLFTGVLGAVMLPIIGVAWYVLRTIFGI
ncbi:MAG: site-2 protease family protein [Betaproteobacteria bacterium]|nr:MAG: site-2 protease family protein [Betaproteobacteria bacterium]